MAANTSIGLVLTELGLSKNEGQIYEALLRGGDMNISQIAKQSRVHRRSVYDCIDRLLNRGLVFEIKEDGESYYQAVEPEKLSELVREKQELLNSTMPILKQLYRTTPADQELLVYRGIEGWKNCMRDILRIGEDYYCIAGKGGWMDPRILNFFPGFIKDLKKKKIGCHVLFEHEVKSRHHDITKYVGPHYRFLPKGFSTDASVEIFGDRVYLIADITYGKLGDDFWFTVIVNRKLADAFRMWFKLMWGASETK